MTDGDMDSANEPRRMAAAFENVIRLAQAEMVRALLVNCEAVLHPRTHGHVLYARLEEHTTTTIFTVAGEATIFTAAGEVRLLVDLAVPYDQVLVRAGHAMALPVINAKHGGRAYSTHWSLSTQRPVREGAHAEFAERMRARRGHT
ncbi:MAG: hypothetical protein M3Q55_09160 [Acidobacteriota bacterium]|nr:hypothetical protein [Acidobacteriota bacterium]